MHKNKSRSVWGAAPAGNIFAKHLQPTTKEYFTETLKHRNEHEIPWLFSIIPFTTFRERDILELGCGAGYDAYEFCRNGARYTGIDITPENIERTIKHLGYYGYSPQVQEGDAEHLSFADRSFDVVYSNGVLHHTPDIQASFNEAYRVLKPGGSFWVILYHRSSIFYWLSLFLVDHILKLGFLKRSFKERLSMIEYTTSDELPLVNAYTLKELRGFMATAGFSVESIWIRKLTREDLPALPLFSRLWEFLPQTWLDAVGARFGWYVIAKGVKRA